MYRYFHKQNFRFLYAIPTNAAQRKYQRPAFQIILNKETPKAKFTRSRGTCQAQHQVERLRKHQMQQLVRLQHTGKSLPTILQELLVPKKQVWI